MPTSQALQLITVPHRPTRTDQEIDNDLRHALEILLKAKGLVAAWRGRKHEDLFTRVYVIIWDSLESSHYFFTSAAYEEFWNLIQPALNGRKINWTSHALIGASITSDDIRFKSIISSPAIEVALTKVIEGGVSGYYDQFQKVVVPILDHDAGCEGYFISPQIENPQHQMLLINWKSIDAHHEVFEKKPTFQKCIAALSKYYGEFVVPWHIVDLQLISGKI